MAFVDNKPRTINFSRETVGKVLLAADCVTGDLLAYNSGWKLATATTVTSCVVACEDGVIGETINVTPFALIKSITGMTAGTALYTAAAGAYQGSTGKRMGISLSDNEAYVLPVLVPIT